MSFWGRGHRSGESHLRLCGQRLILGLSPLLGLLLGCGEETPSRGEEEKPLNVLLISLDSTRYDLLGCYGYRPKYRPNQSPSPHLDQLSKAGVRFEQAYASSSWTLASHASLMTGQPDVVHGVDIGAYRIPPARLTFAELFQEEGYATYGFFSGPYLDTRFGFSRGFDDYEACYGEELYQLMERCRDLQKKRGALQAERRQSSPPLSPQWRQQMRRVSTELADAQVRLHEISHQDISSERVTEEVLKRLADSEQSDRPFFIFAHYFDPHYDYVPVEPYDALFDPDYQGDMSGKDFYTNPAVSLQKGMERGRDQRERKISDRDLEHIWALYAGELAWTDAQIGRILEAIQSLGMESNTLIIVTGDHGDEFFEHGNLGHRKTLYEEVLRVPLMFKLPEHIESGRVCQAPVSNVDVLATALDYAGIDLPEEMADQSLRLTMEGQAGGEDRGIIGRLVTTEGFVQGTKQGISVFVDEVYRQGDIKVYRERRWTEPAGKITRAEFEVWTQQQAIEREKEYALSWLNLKESPKEDLSRRSSDFSGPEIGDVLRGFQRQYDRWLERRSAPADVEASETDARILQALGYVDAEQAPPAMDADRFQISSPKSEDEATTRPGGK